MQDISEGDAIAEGVEQALSEDTFSGCSLNAPLYGDLYFARFGFKLLWNLINKSPEKQWDANPRVTAYTYEFLWELPEEAM